MTLSKRLFIYLFLGVAALVIASCSPGEPLPETGNGQTSTAPSRLANTRWTLVSFGEPGAETSVIAAIALTLEFDDQGQAGGSGGCNSFGAPYTVEGDTLSFGQITSTLMACEQEGIGDQETEYFRALETAGRFVVAGERLTLWYDNGQRVLNFIAAESLPTETPAQNSGLLDSTGTPSATPKPSAITEPTSTPTQAAGQPTPVPQRINFETGETSAKVSGTLEPAGSNLYVLSALGGQTMTVDLSFAVGKAILAIRGEDGSILLSDHVEATHFQGVLPSTQDYFILLKGRPDGSTNYSMRVTIPPIGGDQPTPVPERIDFETGETSATVMGSLPASGSDFYVLSAVEGQTMTVELSFTEGRAILAIWGADGTVLMSDHAEASSFRGDLPSTQDYYILLKGRPDGETDYSMEVTIPPEGSS